jgi:arylsulfatase A-like enzyme
LLCRHAASWLDRLMSVLGREARHPLEYDRYRKSAAEITDGALRWVGSKPDQPYFLFLNYFDAHDPYLLPPGVPHRYSTGPLTFEERRTLRGWDPGYVHSRSPGQIQQARDAYDECLAYLDGELGRLCEGLRRMGRLDDTIVVITSDHGEHFGEHAIGGVPVLGHRATLYQPEIHVPLIIRAPGRVPAGVRVTSAVGLRDLPATIVALAGLGAGSPLTGVALLAGQPPSPAAAEFAPARDLPPALRSPADAGRAVRALVTAEHSYLRYGDGREELYDLQNDPGESENLSAEPAAQDVLDRLREALRTTPAM